MNFDEWLKQGLDDTPGGEWNEAKVDEVVSAARKRRATGGRTGIGSTGRSGVRTGRRGSAALRTASVAAAALVIAAGVIGGIVWNGQHTSANKSPTRDHHGTGPTQTHQNHTSNQTSNDTANPTGSDTTHSLQMYGAGKLSVAKAIPWPGVQQNSGATNTMTNVVQVPFTVSVTTPKLKGPKTIGISLPAKLKGKLVAYFVQMDATTSFYLIGPPGMTGKAELATDGSFAVYLHNAHATLEVDTSGGSSVMADAMAAPFFTSAAQAANSNVQGAGWGPLAPATLTHPNAQAAYFAFQAKSGQNVAGWNDYLQGSSAQSARMIYESDAKDWSYAPYVLNAGVNLLKVLAPQIGGTSILPPGKIVTVGGKKYSLQSVYGNFVATPAGVAYIMGPPLSRKGSPQDMGWADVPTAPYHIAITAPPQTTQNTTSENTSMPGTIPNVQVIDADNDVYYAYPGSLKLINNRWLMYSVAWAVPGMNQPAGNDLHVFDLRTDRDTLVTSYLAAGGNQFAVGTSGDYLAYDLAYYTYNSVGGTLVHRPYVVNLSTGTKLKLPSTDVVPDKSASSGFAVRFGMGGSVITVPLQAQ